MGWEGGEGSAHIVGNKQVEVIPFEIMGVEEGYPRMALVMALQCEGAGGADQQGLGQGHGGGVDHPDVRGVPEQGPAGGEGEHAEEPAQIKAVFHFF